MDTTETQSDFELLAAFSEHGCETAFTTLVHRHIGLVYSAAFQRLHDSHLAEDVVQAVFVLLARKASRISSATILSGWLYRTAQYTANDLLKKECRRSKRHEICSFSECPPAQEMPEEDSAGLDSALEQLSEKDRLVILLRFFEEKSIREVSLALGIGEEAARKRIDRAIEKLRPILDRRNGVVSAPDVIRLLTAYPKGKLPEGAAIRVATAGLAGTIALSDSVLKLVRAALQAMLLARLERILALCALCVIPSFVCFMLTQPREPAVPIPTAKEVVARHFAAIEPAVRRAEALSRERGNACLSCHRPGKVDLDRTVRGICLRGEWRNVREALTGRFEIRMAGMQRLIEQITISSAGAQIRGRDNVQAWMISPEQGARLLTSAEASQFRQETTYLLWPEKSEITGYADRASFGELLHYRLQAPGEAELFFDSETGLFSGSVWRRSDGGRATNALSAYHDFNGLLAPSRIVLSGKESEQIFLVQSARVRDFPLRIFDPPPDLSSANQLVQ